MSSCQGTIEFDRYKNITIRDTRKKMELQRRHFHNTHVKSAAFLHT